MNVRTHPWLLLLTLSLLLPACTKAEAPAGQSAPAAAAPAPESASTAAGSAAAPAPVPATATAPSAIASADGEQSGVRVEVTELRRVSGGAVNLKFTMINDSSDGVNFGYNFVEKNKGYGDIGGVHLIDQEGKKKYFVARDSEGNCVCSRDQKDLPAGQRRNLWAKFPAPPAGVKKISVVIPHFTPLDDVPIAE